MDDFKSETPWSIEAKEVSDPDKYLYDLKKEERTSKEFAKADKAGLSSNLIDVLAGDLKARSTTMYNSLNFNSIKKYLAYLQDSGQMSSDLQSLLTTEAWRLNFRRRPPTIEEFLSEEYLGVMSSSINHFVRDTLTEFYNPLKPYRNLIIYTCVGAGKSTLTMLSNLYIATHYALMWHPYKFFGGMPSSGYALGLVAWTKEKANELYSDRLFEILEACDYFVPIKTKNEMATINRQLLEGRPTAYGDMCLPYTRAAGSGTVCSFANNLSMKPIASETSQMGTNIVHASFSELAWFLIAAGWTNDKIWSLYTKVQGRIDSRMKGNYYGRMILDSSPNSLESVIDQYINNDAHKDPKNLIVSGSRWKLFPEEFSGYIINGKPHNDFEHAFPMFKGSNGEAPSVVDNEAALKSYVANDIVWCPREQITASGSVSFLGNASSSPIEFLRDFAGVPVGSLDRIFYNQKIIEHIFDNDLPCIYAPIVAKSTDLPEHLIFDQVKDILFYKQIDHLVFRYKPHLPRVASVDLAKAGDTAAIAVSHVELMDREDGEQITCYVTDFVVEVIPFGGHINIDAFKFFILDLIEHGLEIKYVGFDQFQSTSFEQGLSRAGLKTRYTSVDRSNDPYLQFIDAVNNGRYFAGKNIMLKNNLFSIHMSKRRSGSIKVDHFNGDNVYQDSFCMPYSKYSEESWTKSQVGINAKDALDCCVSNVTLLNTYIDEFSVPTLFTPYNKQSTDYKASLSSFLKSNGLTI